MCLGVRAEIQLRRGDQRPVPGDRLLRAALRPLNGVPVRSLSTSFPAPIPAHPTIVPSPRRRSPVSPTPAGRPPDRPCGADLSTVPARARTIGRLEAVGPGTRARPPLTKPLAGSPCGVPASGHSAMRSVPSPGLADVPGCPTPMSHRQDRAPSCPGVRPRTPRLGSHTGHRRLR